ARAAQRAGAILHGGTPVLGLEREGAGWRLRTAQGATIRAAQVLIATNGYTDGLWPGLRQSIIAANSFIVATAPLPDEIGRGILPGGEVASDSRRLLLYFRKDASGRLLMGGRGPFREPGAGRDDRARLQRPRHRAGHHARPPSRRRDRRQRARAAARARADPAD
ncbi:NAD(P)/FAD-dependent oxidoreductase, partial [Burkholderia cepacia]|uniref:NAD(P)/FAD-dependent oxidoreductase n=1 Tax=Burkholderia cepacia TaxID=292 RepID=UPI00158ED40B